MKKTLLSVDDPSPLYKAHELRSLLDQRRVGYLCSPQSLCKEGEGIRDKRCRVSQIPGLVRITAEQEPSNTEAETWHITNTVFMQRGRKPHARIVAPRAEPRARPVQPQRHCGFEALWVNRLFSFPSRVPHRFSCYHSCLDPLSATCPRLLSSPSTHISGTAVHNTSHLS